MYDNQHRDHQRAVFGIFASRGEAEQANSRLRDEGFLASDISLLIPDADGQLKTGIEKASKAPEGAAAGAGAGMALGGVFGWIVGAGALAIPGLGVFVAAGPILGMLAGVGAGAAVGAAAGGLIGLGLPEFEAKRYAEQLREGKILMSVHTSDSEQVERAEVVLKACGATDVTTTGESAVPSPERVARTTPNEYREI